MGGERQGPKGGGYVGGFLQLFDWNAKARKKLFSSKSDLPEHSKQGKTGEGHFPVTRIHMENEIGKLSIKGTSDYDEEEYVHRAPGVVGRLMGLDSLPTSNSIDPYSSPFFDTQSLNEFQFRRIDLQFLNSRKFFNEAESLPSNKMERKYQRKSFTRPLEKFQKEVLPPKSAKSIPITQHKLLSPIKKPGFVQSNDTAHIMEAAARIIDRGPHTSVRRRLSSSGPSSTPLKVKELKEKMVAQKKPLNRSFKTESSASTKSVGKSVNLAIQAKVNVQKREGGLSLSRNVIMNGAKEDDKKPSACTAGSKVLRQNNQKQSPRSGKENVPPSKSSGNNVNGRKAGSRKSTLDKDASLSGTRNVPRKKRSIDKNQQDLRNEKSKSKSNSEESRKKGADAVSFTFITPMDRSRGNELPKQLAEERNSIFADNRSQNDVVGDSLSVLLEQKLRELTNGTEPDSCNSIISEASSAASWSTTGKLQKEILQMDNMYNQLLSSFSSTEPFKRYDQEGEIDECSSTKVETGKLYNHLQPNPVPILDSYDLNESSKSSSDSTESNTTEECKTQSSCDHGQETGNSSCLEKIHDLDTEMGTSHSSSSSKDWELDYIKDILSNVELMFKDCASGRTRDIINPHLFDQMERKRAPSTSYKEAPMAEKKALFDCVRDCLDLRCQRYIGGGFSALEKGLKLVRRKEKLAMEVYKEIQEWRRLRDCMVDEVVDMDMSVEYGKWVDFEGDGFGIGVDVEGEIFDCLVGEVIDDILAGSRCNGYAGVLSRV